MLFVFIEYKLCFLNKAINKNAFYKKQCVILFFLKSNK